MAVLQDVKDDGTTYDRYQPKPTLAPVRPLGTSTPMYGTPQSATQPAPQAPIQERGQTPATPQVQPPPPTTPRNPALPPKATGGLDAFGDKTPTGGQPPAPPSQPMIPPPPPPVGSVGGPMVQPPAPGTPPPNIAPVVPSTGGPMIQPPAPGSTGTPVAPATTGASANITPIVPGGPGDLRYQTITGNDPRLGQTQSQTDTARNALASSPDRQALAAQAFQLLRDQTAPQFAADQRAIGQSAAKFGRIGAGMTTNELTSLDQSRERDLLNAQRGLSLDAAGSTLADNQARLASLSGLEGQQYGQGQASRDELRGERGYQNQTDQQARQDEIQRQLLQDQLLNSQFGREQGRAGLDAQIGFGQDPTGVLQNQGNYYGDQANASGEGNANLLDLWAQSQAGQALPPAPTLPTPEEIARQTAGVR